ncbi:MAG TPA: GNAT family N-acetyltransferase [Humidesulfovibrio sp.]|uniref:GNAT family N-acetyltransferase n=1 Tax=Humidesulfovibrio sp. TaxID=2910988 RepID=UPI002C318D9A|nr:GNAT family N-acetyltransferase [Humidesulfovibrio sp.]HWR03409.1 GNAT family N-acetyltransferase [Humidesulfovibrio sp.]
MLIRDARQDDIPGILAIYNDAVANTTAIWNETEVDAANRSAWMQERQRAGLPVLVAHGDGQVLGYASYGPWRPFEGYRHTVEHSVYVLRGRRGGGIGKSLMLELIARARTQGLHAMVAGIEAGNEASLRLHRSLGFESAGVLREVGTKFGKWLDLAFLSLILETPGQD